MRAKYLAVSKVWTGLHAHGWTPGQNFKRTSIDTWTTAAVCRVPTVTRNAGVAYFLNVTRNRGSVGNAMVIQPERSASAQAGPRRTVAYFGLVTRNTSLVAKGTSVQNVTLPRPLVPYTQLQ